MGPKVKSSKGPKKEKKKSDDGKGKAGEESEFDQMEIEELRETVAMYQNQLNDITFKRNFLQIEMDSIQQYFGITKREVKEIELSIAAKEREIEIIQKNHLIELRVYQQKVKHLEYEHSNHVSQVEKKNTEILKAELDRFSSTEKSILIAKDQIKLEKNETEILNAETVLNIKLKNEKALNNLRAQFEDGITELRNRCVNRLHALERDLELKCRVDEHEVEERKNQHVNELVRNHNKAFVQMKKYYNEITQGNLQLIKQLQNQVELLKIESAENKGKITYYTSENLKLSEPLDRVRGEIAKLQLDLKERAKDKMNLSNSKLRLVELEKDVTELRHKLTSAQEEYHKVEKERDDLFKSFEEGIQRVKQQSDFQNEALEQKIASAERAANLASFQMDEIIKSAGLDPSELSIVLSSLNALLLAKEEEIKKYSFEVVKARKTFNDSFLTVCARMRQMEIPEQEIQAMGFELEDYPVGSTDAPAALVPLR